MNDIVLNEKIKVDDNGAVTNQEKLSEWIPIGTSSINSYKGTFDGNGKTISGLYIKSTADYQGLFGRVNGGTVKDLSVSGSVTADTLQPQGAATRAQVAAILQRFLSE